MGVVIGGVLRGKRRPVTFEGHVWLSSREGDGMAFQIFASAFAL